MPPVTTEQFHSLLTHILSIWTLFWRSSYFMLNCLEYPTINRHIESRRFRFTGHDPFYPIFRLASRTYIGCPSLFPPISSASHTPTRKHFLVGTQLSYIRLSLVYYVPTLFEHLLHIANFAQPSSTFYLWLAAVSLSYISVRSWVGYKDFQDGWTHPMFALECVLRNDMHFFRGWSAFVAIRNFCQCCLRMLCC